MRIWRRHSLLLQASLVSWYLAVIVVPTPAQVTAQNPLGPSPWKWNEAVQSLASTIASLAGRDKPISFEVHNISSLTPDDVARIRQSLETELDHRRFHLVPLPQAGNQAVVTLSEGAEGYIWVVEVRADSAERIQIIAVAAPPATSTSSSGPAIVLEKRLVWQQSAPFLDFAVLAPQGSPVTLLILERDRLESYVSPDATTWQLLRNVPIAHSTVLSRDSHGSIDTKTNEVLVANVRCSINFGEPERMQCASQPQTEQPITRIEVPGHEESETALLSDRCDNTSSIVLSTGNGDWTQPDSVQAYLLTNVDQDARPSGDPVYVNGPVISLQPQAERNAARAVVHNLKTGNYEAYIITANCAH